MKPVLAHQGSLDINRNCPCNFYITGGSLKMNVSLVVRQTVIIGTTDKWLHSIHYRIYYFKVKFSIS